MVAGVSKARINEIVELVGLKDRIHELRGYLKRLAHEEGVAVFVSSHLLSEMELMCDRVGVLQNGKLVSIQSVQDFIHKGGVSRVCVTVEPNQTEQAKRLIATLNKTALPAGHKSGNLHGYSHRWDRAWHGYCQADCYCTSGNSRCKK